MEMEQMDFYESEISMDQVTVSQLDSLGREIAQLREKVEAMEEVVKEERATLEAMKSKMIAYLDHFGKKSYPIPGAGTFTVAEKISYTVPKEDSSKIAFFKWLRSKGEGAYLSTITVNHNTLNALCNEEFELAAHEGRRFHIPGLGEPKKYETLRMTKGK